ncbi:MAG TPA: hypothetical protein VF746_08850 [Longimicrobium sp.]
MLGSRCPFCRDFILKPRYREPDGTAPPVLKPLPFWDRAAVAECPKCNHTWPVFADGDPAGEPQATSLVSFVETDRVEEPLGQEQRIIDNSKSSITLTRRFSLSKEWSQSYVLEYEKAQQNGTQLTIGAGDALGFQATAESNLKQRYSITEEARQVYAEEITLEVPARTRLRVVFDWKRIWQRGVVVVQHGPGQLLQVPFRVVVGVTFDQAQVDEN